MTEFGDAVMTRHDDGTVTVERADRVIGVHRQVIEGAAPWVFPNGDPETIQLDTAGEYLYRRIGRAEYPPFVDLYARIEPGGIAGRALVTGSAGFVGRHMIADLRDRGWLATGVDLLAGGDARDAFRYDHMRYDLVVHVAYHVGGRAAIDGEPRMLARNLELDAMLFDWAVRTGQGRVLYFSSSAAYPTDLQDDFATARPLREDDIHLDRLNIGRPDARYGWAKLTGEQLARAAREAGLPVTVVRPFSGYGEDQDDTYPFRAFVERARRRESPFFIWGSGEQVRDWIHIDDVVAGALAVVESGTEEPVNLCTGTGTSMFDLARMCCEQTTYRPTFRTLPDKPTGVAYRVGDPARLHRHWTPKVSLEAGVERALAEWTHAIA